MIDFLLKYPLAKVDIEKFATSFINAKKSIRVINIDEFYNVNLSDEELSGICFFVVQNVLGDASLLIQIYRSGDDDLINSLVEKAKEKKISLYLPLNDIEWIFIDENGDESIVRNIKNENYDFKFIPFKKRENSQEINGIKFRYYLNDNGGVTNVHPE